MKITVLGGPAMGLCAAVELAGRGEKVMLQDPVAEPGPHHCSWWAGGSWPRFARGKPRLNPFSGWGKGRRNDGRRSGLWLSGTAHSCWPWGGIGQNWTGSRGGPQGMSGWTARRLRGWSRCSRGGSTGGCISLARRI